jgi:hypothetical protein
MINAVPTGFTGGKSVIKAIKARCKNEKTSSIEFILSIASNTF